METKEDRDEAARVEPETPAPLVETFGTDLGTQEGCFWDAEGRSDTFPVCGETLLELLETLESLLETRGTPLETRESPFGMLLTLLETLQEVEETLETLLGTQGSLPETRESPLEMPETRRERLQERS